VIVMRGVDGTTTGAGRAPGEPPDPAGPPAWLQERLFARRMVLLTGRLDDAAAARAAAELVALDAAGGEPVTLHVDVPDGTLEAAFVVIDTLDLVRARVHAHCRGRAGGPAVGVIAVADRRTASPHAGFRLSQPTVTLAGTADQLAARGRQQRDLLGRFEARLARATGRPVEDVALDLRRGRYLDAGEALAYGLIDAIGGPP
jgi:ATP-dependent Clp protease protease subunit